MCIAGNHQSIGICPTSILPEHKTGYNCRILTRIQVGVAQRGLKKLRNQLRGCTSTCAVVEVDATSGQIDPR